LTFSVGRFIIGLVFRYKALLKFASARQVSSGQAPVSMIMLGRTLLAGLWVGGSLCMVGCGPRTDKAAIKGTVKFKDGRTVTRGVIEFTPLGSSSGGGPATTSGSRIVDSAYEVPLEKGLRPGKYRVRINAASGFPTAQGGPGAVLTLPKELVSAKYNEDSKLEIQVRPNVAEETFDFEVEGG
jgi:hypothetical protein